MLRKSMIMMAGVLLFGALLTGGAQAAVWFVNQSSYTFTGGQGITWTRGFHTVQEGIAAAAAGDQVWVKKGTYLENLSMKDGVALYGGFAGTESLLSQRNWKTNVTILDGNLTGPVVWFNGCTDSRSRVDGFTIQRGTGLVAGGWGGIFCGGGVLCDASTATIANNLITGNGGVPGFIPNAGGGIHVRWSGFATIIDNVVTGNTAVGNHGGGVAYSDANGLMERNIVCNNTADWNGGGVYVGPNPGGSNSPAPTIRDNLIYGNRAGFLGNPGVYDVGGGIYVSASYPKIFNNTVVCNSACRAGGGMVLEGLGGGNPLACNNIVAFNRSDGIYVYGGCTPALAFNDVSGNTGSSYRGLAAGPGDISADPFFANAASGDFHLKHSPLSPCIDAGNNAYANSIDKDLDGHPRIYDGVVDMGAYESGSVPPFTTCSLSGTLGLNGWFISSPVVATLTAVDAGGTGIASTKWAYAGTRPSWNNYTVPITYTLPGTGGLSYYSTDLDGNVEAIRSTTIKLDNSLPAVSIASPAGTSPYTRVSPVAFAGTATDYFSGLLSVRWKNAPAGSGLCAGTASWSASVPLAQGGNRVTIWAKDNAGNSRSTAKMIIYDNIAPTVTSTTPVRNATGIARKPNIRVRFNESVKAAGFNVLTALYDPNKNGNNRPGYWKATAPTYSGNIMSFGPYSTMSGNTRITVNLNAGAVQDYAGNTSAFAYTWGFKTGTK